MRHARRESGFTLLETLLSLGLTALLVGMMVTITRQWISNWNLGAARLGQIESLALTENRIISDIEAAINLPSLNLEFTNFIGGEDRIILLREPVPADATNRLVLIRYQNNSEFGITRSLAIYNALLPISEQKFSEEISLLPPPYEIHFEYSDDDNLNRPTWTEVTLPAQVIITLPPSEQTPSSTRIIRLRTQIDAGCIDLKALQECQDLMKGSLKRDAPGASIGQQQTATPKNGAAAP